MQFIVMMNTSTYRNALVAYASFVHLSNFCKSSCDQRMTCQPVFLGEQTVSNQTL